MSPGCGTGEVLVPQPLDVVFDYVADLRHMTKWWPEHHTYRRLRGDGGRGAIYAWTTTSFGGFPLPGLTFVTAHERPTRFAYRVIAPGMTFHMTYRFASVEMGTHVALETRSPLLRLKALQRKYPEEVARTLDRLAATLTASGVASVPGLEPSRSTRRT
jgi:uncharacterized protein YndB with AHSA1/START domain